MCDKDHKFTQEEYDLLSKALDVFFSREMDEEDLKLGNSISHKLEHLTEEN
ncbi:MAG: hypothetical protein ACFFD7_15575 [Candidatus Thorarchaeota archaeon]